MDLIFGHSNNGRICLYFTANLQRTGSILKSLVLTFVSFFQEMIRQRMKFEKWNHSKLKPFTSWGIRYNHFIYCCSLAYVIHIELIVDLMEH